MGIEPKTRAWTGLSAVSLVVSLNLKRRHLTMAQRAMAAADSLPHYEAEAKKRQVAGGKEKVPEKIPEAIKGDARDHAARDFKVTSSSPSFSSPQHLP